MNFRNVVLVLVLGTVWPFPVQAFSDADFCSAAKQLAAAAEQDVGVWLDRATRNAGMGVWCDRKIVEFKHFTDAATASMTNEWKVRKLDEWNSDQCGSALWAEAIRQGWNVQLSVTATNAARIRCAAPDSARS